MADRSFEKITFASLILVGSRSSAGVLAAAAAARQIMAVKVPDVVFVQPESSDRVFEELGKQRVVVLIDFSIQSGWNAESINRMLTCLKKASHTIEAVIGGPSERTWHDLLVDKFNPEIMAIKSAGLDNCGCGCPATSLEAFCGDKRDGHWSVLCQAGKSTRDPNSEADEIRHVVDRLCQYPICKDDILKHVIMHFARETKPNSQIVRLAEKAKEKLFEHIGIIERAKKFAGGILMLDPNSVKIHLGMLSAMARDDGFRVVSFEKFRINSQTGKTVKSACLLSTQSGVPDMSAILRQARIPHKSENGFLYVAVKDQEKAVEAISKVLVSD